MYRSDRKQHGFVLVMTLVLLAIVTLALAATVRLSLREASAVREAQQELQRRWGTLSCQYTLLPKAEELLSKAEADHSGPLISTPVLFELGDLNFELIVGDEQAKANARVLLQRRGREDAQRLLRELLVGFPLATSLQLRLPQTQSQNIRTSWPLLGSFGQVFDVRDVQLLIDPASGQGAATDVMTLWGDGRLNYRRVAEQTLRIVACPPLDLAQVQRLLDIRHEAPKMPLSQALNTLQLSLEKRAAASVYLRDGSRCYSLWINISSRQRSWHRLVVSGNSGNRAAGEIFDW